MLKNKILIFFIITLIFTCFFTCSVYASTDLNNVYEDGFEFIGSSGTTYKLPPYPQELKEYNHYVIIKTTIWEQFYILPFNETLEVVSNNSSTFNVLLDGKNFSELYWECSFNDSSPDTWVKVIGQGFHFSKTNNPHTVVDSCPCFKYNQTELQEIIDGNESFFLSRQAVLVPIMEKAPLATVLKEIIVILPVILMTIVGLIGLRKALKFLSTALHRS